MSSRISNIGLVVWVSVVLGFARLASPQIPDSQNVDKEKVTEPIQKLGENLFRIGQIRVDTAKREISVSGTANPVTVLEFVANTRNGMKAYESALTLDTDAITFNTALVLIGLDKTHAKVPTRHFDPLAPEGDPVELWVEWARGAEHGRVGAEQLLFDRKTGQTLPPGAWVYTGSFFLPDGRYLAETDGVLIGFVHSPAPIIESPLGPGVGRYGAIILNPNLNLTAGTTVTLTVKALRLPDQR
jgi:hypothetical protein